MKVAIVGGTGAVGLEFLRVLEERQFPVGELRVFATKSSAEKTVTFRGEKLRVEELSAVPLQEAELAFFSAGGSVSREFAPLIKKRTIVIDNSSAFRMDPGVPLVVPEVNGGRAREHHGIISNPNCSTIQLVVVLKPIMDAAGLRRVVVATYQSVSGTGIEAIEELELGTEEMLSGRKPVPRVYPHRIAFNVFPFVEAFDSSGYTVEEKKVCLETKKILEDESFSITATAVRVPVKRCHSEAVNIETKKKLLADEVRRILGSAPSVTVLDKPEAGIYPTPELAEGKDDVFVGRIREDSSIPCGIDLWIVSDNLRKGAALNAVQIAELLFSTAASKH
ncbi:MAG: aspartate-semialdehyde dehydrogenase [Candidatus Eisenbacteria bacterium]|nr:aspartate-semialdehyde dehydrogenase [Candidatus Eisenbacteria bacterium]